MPSAWLAAVGAVMGLAFGPAFRLPLFCPAAPATVPGWRFVVPVPAHFQRPGSAKRGPPA